MSNIEAAKAVADAVRTSLGPKGMDKMIKDDKENVTITNDGATILQRMKVLHPAARMLVELSKAQDIEAGDGTTTVVVICGALLEAAKELLAHGSHPTRISDAFQRAASEAMKVLDTMAIPFDLKDRDAMIKAAQTSLSSKVKFYSTLYFLFLAGIYRVTIERTSLIKKNIQSNTPEIFPHLVTFSGVLTHAG